MVKSESKWFRRCAFCSYEDMEHHGGCTWAAFLRAAAWSPNGLVVALASGWPDAEAAVLVRGPVSFAAWPLDGPAEGSPKRVPIVRAHADDETAPRGK
jgi:hypothetical protein